MFNYVTSVNLLQVPVEEVEWQFWNIVTTPDKPLEVRRRDHRRSMKISIMPMDDLVNERVRIMPMRRRLNHANG